MSPSETARSGICARSSETEIGSDAGLAFPTASDATTWKTFSPGLRETFLNSKVPPKYAIFSAASVTFPFLSLVTLI